MDNANFDRSVLGHEAARLLEALLERLDEAGRVQISTPELLEASGLGRGALARARAELTCRGLLHVVPGYSLAGLKTANIFRVNTHAFALDSPLESIENRANLPHGEGPPGASPVRPPSESPRPTWKDLWSRLLGRSRSS